MGGGGGRGEFSRHFRGGLISSPGFGKVLYKPPGNEAVTNAINDIIERKLISITIPVDQTHRLERLKEITKSALEKNMDIVSINVVGSIAKGTQIKKKEGNDVDLEVILNKDKYGEWLNNENGTIYALEKTKDALKSDPRFRAIKVRVDRNAVTAILGGLKVDVVPVFEHSNGGVLVSDTHTRKWLRSDPRRSKRILEIIDSRNENKVVPLIRILKDWNQKNGRKLNSVTIEAMAEHYFVNDKPKNGENSNRANVHEFFSKFPYYLQNGISDQLFDQRVDTYLNEKDRDKLISRAQRTSEKIDKAERAARDGNVGESTRLYREALK